MLLMKMPSNQMAQSGEPAGLIALIVSQAVPDMWMYRVHGQEADAIQ